MGTIFQVNESNGNTIITGSLTMSSNKIHNVTDPTLAQDAATKNYVDTAPYTSSTLPTNDILVGNGSNVATAVAMSGDVTIVSSGVTAIGLGAVTGSKIASSTITNTNLASGVFAAITGVGIQSQALNMNSHLINNVTDPTLAQDAATKNYVDNVVNGLTWKLACQLATTTALPAYTYYNGSSGVGATITINATGTLTIDNTLTVLGNRILVKNETGSNAPYNGIYIVTTAGAVGVQAVLTRTADFDTATEVEAGAAVYILFGTANTTTSWASAITVTIVIGTTNILFVQVAGPGAIVINGTTNQVNVGTVGTTFTLSTPQAIATTSSPTFQNLTLGSTTIGGLILNDTEGTPKTVTIEAPSTLASTWIMKLPISAGSSNYFLQTDGSGTTSWAPGGSGTISSGTSGQNAVYTGTNTIGSGQTMSMNSTKITSLANGTAASDAAAFGQIFAGFQAPVQATDTTSFSTTAVAFAATNLNATITPTSASHRIKVTVTGTGLTDTTQSSAIYATLGRGATELSGVTGGFVEVYGGAIGGTMAPLSITYIDSPATTSATTYTLYVKSDNATHTVIWNQGSTKAVMILEEIV